MKQTKTILGRNYQAPKTDVFSLAPEGILCNSKVNAMTETGASWTDETDASLEW